MMPPHPPMLATKFRGKLPSPRVFIQRKYDGVRCIANEAGLWSRSGRKITSCAHIEQALRPLFGARPTLSLDGELYAHGLDLSTIIAIVNKRAPAAAESSSRILFHVFDTQSHPDTFSGRSAFLRASIQPLFSPSSPIRFVETTTASSVAEVDDLYRRFRGEGFEGQIIRTDAPYSSGRTKHLLKRKPFDDAEFDVVHLTQARSASYANRVTLRLDDGREFGANIKATRSQAEALFRYTPISATVRFFGLTPSGIPRSPVAIAFHSDARL